MRKLPVYLLLDTSGSMSGEPIESLKIGLRTLIESLRAEPQIIEMAHLSIITFSDRAYNFVPITPITNLQMPDESKLVARGTTNLGEALTLLNDSIEKDVVTGDKDREIQGDYKALVFLLTDGNPTDRRWESAVAKLNRKKIAYIVSLGLGDLISTDNLEMISQNPEYVYKFSETDPATFKDLFKAISQSITTSVGVNNEDPKPVLPPKPGEDDDLL